MRSEKARRGQLRSARVHADLKGLPTQPDPIGLAGGLNLYGYAGGDPINFSDPFGLAPCRVTGRWGNAIVDETVAMDFQGAMNQAYENGYRGNVNSSYRSSRAQANLKRAGKTSVDSGGSAHEAGTAVDADYQSVPEEQRSALDDAMSAHGFDQTYERRHHFEHSSTRGNSAQRRSLISENGNYASSNIGACFQPAVHIQTVRGN